ncbi:hypothetical protein [Paenibacillus sp. y28]|uniref:hypothetical protein n=1 Tax=Paenibacillus sp. y28 TaxID=3129110 RepID=UPI003016DF82
MRNIQVTAANITHVPFDVLQRRFRKLMRKKADTSVPEEVEEVEVIKQFFQQSGREFIIEQLELDIPRPKKEQYVAIVEEKLRTHRTDMLRQKELERTLKESRVEIMFGVSRFGSESGVRGGGSQEYRSPVERAVGQAEERIDMLRGQLRSLEAKMRRMERALGRLSLEQQELLGKKYLTYPDYREPLDDIVMGQMNMGRQRYYQQKKAALCKIAVSLRLI